MWRVSDEGGLVLQELRDLRSKSSWFGRTGREDGVIAALDRIRELGELAALGSVAGCLFESSHRVRQAASRTIHHLLSLIPPERLPQLHDAGFGSWRWYLSDAWDRLTPKSVSSLVGDLEHRVALLGLLSFHRNGYVRQEAVRLLDREASGDELRYLLIRQNDWVRVIADEAQAAVNRRLADRLTTEFVRCLPLVFHLFGCRRNDLSRFVRTIVELLVQPRHDAMLAELVHGASWIVRRHVVRVAFEMAGEHRLRVIRHGLTSTDDVIRWMCAKRIGEDLSGQERREAMSTVQRDRFMPARREGFRVEAHVDPDHAPAIWRRALLDPNPAIRYLARYSLRELGSFDPAVFYRETIGRNGASPSSVSGLAECGDASDLESLRNHLSHWQPSVRRAAIAGMARIAGNAVVSTFVPLLRDPCPGVVRAAAKRLGEFPHDVPGEALMAVVIENVSDVAGRCAFRLILAKGKWLALAWLLRIAGQGDAAAVLRARDGIEALFSPPQCNRVFAKPFAEEKEAILRAMAEYPADRDAGLLTKVSGWLQAVGAGGGGP
jgi:HEAT repeat protein